MKRLVTALLLLVAAWQQVLAQNDVWSLDRCIGYALEHNSGILLANVALGSSREQLLYSKLQLLPTLNLNVNQYYNWGRSVDMQELVIVRNRLTQQTSGSVGASFSIFDGFARFNTIAANKALVDAATGDKALAAVQLKADITRAYLAGILARLTEERLRESHSNILRQESRIRAEAESGGRDALDILELEAKASDIDSRIAEAAGEYCSQLLQLRTLMGCGSSIETETGHIETDCDLLSSETETKADMGYVPPVSITAQQNRVKAAEYALKAARGGQLPSISLSAAYGTYYSDASGDPFGDQIDGNRNPSVSLSLSVPIFNGGSGAAAVAKARSDLASERLRLQQAEETARSEFAQMLQQAATLKSQMNTCRLRSELCRERLRTATARYQLGAISTSEWLDACEDLSQSECDLVQCQCKYLFQLKIIDYYRDGCKE